MVEKDVIFAAVMGHSFLLLGQAGTGKTTLLKKVCNVLTTQQKKSVKMTAMTGMAASLLPGGTTIHRLIGLMDGRYTSNHLAEKILHDDDYLPIKKNIVETDTIIIDEVSQLSKRIFTQIEEVCRHVRHSSLPFGGVQMILCGDLFQLKPVPNIIYGDRGEFFFEASHYNQLVPHHFVLQRVHRQEEGDLINAVNELSKGCASEETVELLHRLKRPLPPGYEPVKLFSLRYDVDRCNSDNLLDMPDEAVIYRSVDSGNIDFLRKSRVPSTLYIK
ncbi:uncharacterized protein LOC144451594 [Glandiceps talaboti]